MQKLKKYQQYIKPPQNQYDEGVRVGNLKPPLVQPRVGGQSPILGYTSQEEGGSTSVGGFGAYKSPPAIETNGGTSSSGGSFLDLIYSSPNPELALQKYMMEVGMLNIFELYQKNIAGLDEARQKDIADAYYIRELTKKYLGEYASNVGIGDVSGELIDIYANYASNLAYISQNYEQLQAGYEEKLMASEMKYAEKLLGVEVGLKGAEYNETLYDAQVEITSKLQSGDYGDYDNFNDWLKDYVNQLDLPTKYKEELSKYGGDVSKTYTETAFVAIKGAEFVNSAALERFGVAEQPNIDPSYYTNKDVMSGYAFIQGGNIWGVATEATDLPSKVTEDFSWRKDGQGFVTYQGDIYLYMPDGTFHKMVRLEVEGMQFSNLQNGDILERVAKDGTKHSVNGVDYKEGKEYYWGVRAGTDLPDGMLDAFGLEVVDNRIRPKEGNMSDFTVYEKSGGKVFFYNGRFYFVYFKDKANDKSDGLRIIELNKA